MSRGTVANRELQAPFGPDFEKLYPGAKVEVEYPAGNFHQALQTAIAGGAPPDLAFIQASRYQELVVQGQITNLDGYLRRDKAFRPGDYLPIWFKGLQFKGQQYALPYDPSAMLLFYNRAIFDRAQLPYPSPRDPLTWQRAVELAQRLTLDQQGVDSTRSGFDAAAIRQVGIWIPTNYFWWFLPRQNGQEAYSGDLSQVLLDRPQAREALQWLVDLFGRFRAGIDPGLATTVARVTGPAGFLNGNVAMTVFGLWSVPDWRARLTDDWDVAPLPLFQGKQRLGLAWGSGNAVATGARNPEGAWHFAKYLAGPDAQATFMRGGYVQPMLTAQANHPSYRQGTPPHSKDVPIREAEVAIPPAFYPPSLDLQGMILPALNDVLAGTESLDAMLVRMVPLMNQKLREYKTRFNY